MTYHKEYVYYMYYIQTNHYMYAYTPEKHIRDEFIKLRDMKDFFYEKKLHLTKSDIHDLAVTNQAKILSMKRLETYDWDKRIQGKYSVALSTEEYSSVISNAQKMVISDLFIDSWTPFHVFSEEMQHLLSKMYYDIFSDINTGSSSEHLSPSEVQILNNLAPDYFAIFLKMYRETVRKDI